MSKSRKIGIVLIVIGFLLAAFQSSLLGIAAPKGYWLVHEWLFYTINYLIIFFLFIIGALFFATRYIKWAMWLLSMVLLTVNTTFFYYMGDVNLLIATSDDGQHEVIIKEYKKMKNETVRLERRGSLFGKKDAVLEGSSEYKALEEETYKLDWITEDIAALTYQTGNGEALDQQLFNFRSSDYVRYRNVAVSLVGKWIAQKNLQNYFMSDNNELVYAKDGQLYYYRIENTEQYGIFSVVIEGDETNPSLTVVVNPGSEFDDNGLIAEGGTITITPVSLEETESEVYYRE